jgi:NADH-quinone oxidoreductase subunit G
MATIYIDNKPYEVGEGQNLLHACLSLGFNVPYFCWHPAMHSVGACRQCAVKQFKDAHDGRGRIVMACMTPAADGTRISIDDPEAIQFRKSVIEWLMLNHPHDCPVCDEGGECHLQDMVAMTGHAYRRTRFKKRTYRNQYLGPFINHEMNRCIQCFRCLRFYRDYADGRDFNVFACHDHIYFGRREDGVLESEFSGNLVEVCPTGVFTDKTLKRHYTRKWDLQTAPSVCVHCGLGCNTIPGERYGQLRRIRNRYNSEVNGYFLCDRGRYGYEFVNSDRRIRRLFLDYSKVHRDRGGDTIPHIPTREEVLNHLESILYFGAKVIGIGSPRASLEANFALRTLVGPENYFLGVSETEFSLIRLIVEILQKGPARSPSLHDVEMCDAVFVLGEDVTNAAPMLALSLRRSLRRGPMKVCKTLNIPEWNEYAVCEAIQDEKGPVFIATPSATGLDDIAAQTYRASPDDLARFGFAIAHELDADAPEAPGLSGELQVFVSRIARSLREAGRPLIVSGASCASEQVIKAAANIARALRKINRPAELCFTVPECNTLGLGLIGGGSLGTAFKEVQDGKADTAVILDNDLYRRADKETVDTFFEKINHAIVIDCVETDTTARAGVLLPAGTFTETDGTMVNNEGRVQRYFKVLQPADGVQESWRWLTDLMRIAERPEADQWKLFEDITNALSETIPVFRPATAIAPPAGFRIAGMKIPRQAHRYSGRTSMWAQSSVHEPTPADDPDSPLAFSMEGFGGIPPSSLIPRFWFPGWNSVQAVNKFQSAIGGPLYGGDTGRRLFESDDVRSVSYYNEVPAAFSPKTGELLVLPVWHIFGSEELSVLSPGIAELAPGPYLGLNPKDMERLSVKEGEEVELIIGGKLFCLPVKQTPLSPGIAVLPSGISGLRGIVFPARAKDLRPKRNLESS